MDSPIRCLRYLGSLNADGKCIVCGFIGTLTLRHTPRRGVSSEA